MGGILSVMGIFHQIDYVVVSLAEKQELARLLAITGVWSVFFVTFLVIPQNLKIESCKERSLLAF